MLELINDILSATEGDQLGQLFYLSAMLSAMFFLPYAGLISCNRHHRATVDKVYDAFMLAAFIGIWALGHHSAEFEGVVAIGVGVATALSLYVVLLSPVILIGVTIDFILPAVRARTS